MDENEVVELALSHIAQANALLRQLPNDKEEMISGAQSRLMTVCRRIRRVYPAKVDA